MCMYMYVYIYICTSNYVLVKDYRNRQNLMVSGPKNRPLTPSQHIALAGAMPGTTFALGAALGLSLGFT